MRYFLFSFFLLCMGGCSSAYRDLQESAAVSCPAAAFRPAYGVALYDAEIQVVNKRLSGLLLIKTMPDSSLRILFSGETGITYFDFEYPRDSGFVVHSILKQMNKKAVITTLRKDFELVLMNRLDKETEKSFSDSLYRYFRYGRGHEVVYVVTDTACRRLERLELASRRKPKVQVSLPGFAGGIPSDIVITHRNFTFDITLKRIEH